MSFNPDRINIHELTIEEPEREAELPFDVERDITKEDWIQINNQTEEYRTKKEWWNFADMVANSKILNPEKNLNVDNATWNGMLSDLKNSETRRDWREFARHAMDMKTIDPSKEIPISGVALKAMQDELASYRDGSILLDNLAFVDLATNMKMLYPKEDFGLDQDMLEGMKNELERMKEDDFDRAEYFAFLASHIKIIYPDAELDIDESDWDRLRDELKQYRNQEEWQSFVSIAKIMKILAAKKVKITENGLELTMPKKKNSLVSETPPIPEIKKF